MDSIRFDTPEICPVSQASKQTPNALCVGPMTYAQFELLIQKITYLVAPIPSHVVAWAPKKVPTPSDLALFFALWRLKKIAYPLSWRLPKQAIKERIQKTRAHFLTSIDYNNKLLPLEELFPKKEATYLETSSGSKIAIHTLKAHLISAKEVGGFLKVNSNARYLLNLPLSHVSGLGAMMRTLLFGAHLLLPNDKEDPTHLSLVPTQLFDMLKNNQIPPQIKCLLVGGAPLADSLKKQAIDAQLPLYQSYGMTEAASTVAIRPIGKATHILSHFDVDINLGEIFLKGPSLLKRYFGSERICGWFPTGDLGEFDNGSLEVLGRGDRQFISGGENILPEEIEQLLLNHPDLISASVVPIEDERFGQVPSAVVYTKSSKEKQSLISELTLMLEKTLPHYKIPKQIKIKLGVDEASKLAKMV